MTKIVYNTNKYNTTYLLCFTIRKIVKTFNFLVNLNYDYLHSIIGSKTLTKNDLNNHAQQCTTYQRLNPVNRL